MINFFRRPKIGKIRQGTSTIRQSEEFDVPPTTGRVKGVITPGRKGKEAYFYSYDKESYYITFLEYGEWAGMVCEAEIEVDDSFENPNIKGYAYQIFVRSLGDGELYELPEPDVVNAFPKSKDCRCPFCMIEFATGRTIGAR